VAERANERGNEFVTMSTAQVVVLAGPSGAGKSRLAERLGFPVLRLDDFYKDGDDPSLPRITHGPNAGLVDWDHPESWHQEDALAALRELCATGLSEVPIYEIADNGRSGLRTVHLGGSDRFVAEGIFAPEVVAACREEGMLAAAYCITQHPLVTFWRRLTRDLREHRKPPMVLLLRGFTLMRDQQRVVAHALRQGCRRATGDQAYAELTGQHSRAADAP
jgi:uridine kinase